ncbi:MAG: hypothetical protein WD737_12095 [Gemmatimonadota bacterium]
MMIINRPLLSFMRRRGALVATLAAAMIAGCDQDATEIAQEIDAAREGCTEAALEAGSEECVQMFEKYIDMGTDAMANYIGALRALDEALERRTGIPFDTSGLGHAISPSVESAPDPGISADEAAPWMEGYTAEPGPYYDRDAAVYDSPASRNQNAPYPSGPSREDPTTFDRRPPYADDTREPGRQPVLPDRPTRPARGALLPPDERLRRPWIGDERAPDDYYPERPPIDDGREGPPVGVESGRRGEPYNELPPYPY